MSNASLKEQLQAVASQLPKAAVNGSQKHKRHEGSSAQKNAKPKPKWLDYVQYGVELLKAYFPNCFGAASQIKPLKIGIKQDLVKRLSTMGDIVMDDKACMVKSLSYYVNTHNYLKTVVAGATRIDLDGQSAGLVTAEEAQYSLDKQKSKMQAKEQGKHPSTEPSELSE
jgi:ProP effector